VPLVFTDSNSRSSCSNIESSSGRIMVVARTLQVDREMVEPNFEIKVNGETDSESASEMIRSRVVGGSFVSLEGGSDMFTALLEGVGVKKSFNFLLHTFTSTNSDTLQNHYDSLRSLLQDSLARQELLPSFPRQFHFPPLPHQLQPPSHHFMVRSTTSPYNHKS